MSRICIAKPPKAEPMGLDWFLLVLLLGSPLVMFLMADHWSDGSGYGPFWVTVIISLILLPMLVPIVWTDWQHNRELPGLIEKHLGSPLSARDCEQFLTVTRMHPEVKPWIAAAYSGDQLTYREALRLQERINAYLEELPKRQLDETVGVTRTIKAG